MQNIGRCVSSLCQKLPLRLKTRKCTGELLAKHRSAKFIVALFCLS